MFILCACVYECVENTAMASSIKMILFACVCVCVCVHVGKVYWINVSIVGRSKKDLKKIDFTYIHVYAWVYINVWS